MSEQPVPSAYPGAWHGYAPPRPLGEIVDIGEIIDNMVALRWRVLGIALMLALFGLLLAFFLPPLFTAEALVRIEPEITTAGEQTSIEVEREVITSRSLLMDVTRKMGRSVDVQYGAHYVAMHLRSLVGTPHASTRDIVDTNTPYIGIRILTLPAHFENTPLRIVAKKNGRYAITGQHGVTLFEGQVGMLLESAAPLPGNPQTPTGAVRILIDTIHAPVGTVFHIVPRDHQEFVEKLLHKVRAARRGYRGMSGLLSLEFSSRDPVFAKAFLQELVDTYVTQAFDRSSVGKVRSLTYLEKQLTSLQEQIDSTEAELAAFRSEQNVMDVSVESRLLLEEISDLDRQMADLNVQYNQLSATHGDNHPTMRAIFQQKHYLAQRRNDLEHEIGRMPALERDMIFLTRKLTNLQRLYEVNLEDHNSLKTQVEGISGYARVVSEPSLVKEPPWQRTGLFVLGGFMAGMFGSLIWIFLNSLPAFIRVWRLEQLHHNNRFPLIGLLPYVPELREDVAVPLDASNAGQRLKKVVSYLEQNWRFLFHGAPKPVVVVSSLSPGQGKTTFAVNLAHASAASKKTLLINACLTQRDLRLPFTISRTPGLSDVLVGDAKPESVIVERPDLPFAFISPGTRTASARLIAGTETLSGILDVYLKRFERIIIDYPTLPSDVTQKTLDFAGALILIVRQGSPLHELKRFYEKHPNGMEIPAYIVLNDYLQEQFVMERLFHTARGYADNLQSRAMATATE